MTSGPRWGLTIAAGSPPSMLPRIRMLTTRMQLRISRASSRCARAGGSCRSSSSRVTTSSSRSESACDKQTHGMCRFRRWSDVISPAAVDVAVLGAGVAGSAAALELLAQGCTVALLHRYDPVARFESLSIAASSALERYGIEPGTPIDTVHASWGSSEVRSARHPGARVAERQAIAVMLRDLAAKRG